MTEPRLPLFYRRITALEGGKHDSLRLNSDSTYKFAESSNSVPLAASEFAEAARDYPIVFSMSDPIVPVAIVGLKPDRNLFVGADGNWDKDVYIPAYIRRYPFILVENSEAGKLVLCCDDSADRRISIREATALVSEWAFNENPDLNPTASFDVLEYDVPDLWETLRVQLFYADYVSTDGQRFNSGLWAYYQGELYSFGVTVGGHGLMSGVLQGQAFYYSYSWGSGIHRSVLGKLTIGDGQPEFVESGGFTQRDLFLELVEDEIQVEQGTYRGYDDWTASTPFGTLVDQGSELVVVDSEGNEIVPELPG